MCVAHPPADIEYNDRAVLLSLLDFFQPPARLAAIAQLADRLGFHRFWIGEHHSALQCPNPLLACGVFAGLTRRIRLGTGAVLLHQRKPYEVAQDARMLTQLYGDRLDLGVTGVGRRGPHGWHWHSSEEAPQDSERSVVELLHGYLHGEPPSPADARAGASLVWTDVAPRLWLLGTSLAGAQLAGQLGLGYCTSHHHAGSLQTLRECIAAYRDAFVPGSFAAPSVVAVRSGVCATRRAALEELVGRVSATPVDPFLGYFERTDLLAGLPRELADQLSTFGEALGVDEVMFLPLNYHHSSEEMLGSIEGLASEAGLEAELEDAP